MLKLSVVIQVAIRNTQQGVFYFTDQIPLTALMLEDGRIEPAAFVQTWKNLPEANESQKELPISITSLDSVKSKIEAANIFLMAHKQACAFANLLALLVLPASMYTRGSTAGQCT